MRLSISDDGNFPIQKSFMVANSPVCLPHVTSGSVRFGQAEVNQGNPMSGPRHMPGGEARLSRTVSFAYRAQSACCETVQD